MGYVNSVLIAPITAITIPTVVPVITPLAIPVIPVVVATIAMMLIPIGRHDAAAQERNSGSKQHKNEFHRSLRLTMGLLLAYAPACRLV